MAKKEQDNRDGYSDDLGEAGSIGTSMGDIDYSYDEDTGSYNVDISFARGGSANYSLDADTVQELEDKGGSYYNSSIRGQM